MESRPQGALCEPVCYYEQVVTFHPYEVCVRAATSVGRGWESCTPIHGKLENYSLLYIDM